ncbi:MULTISPECIES: PLP-dependent aminotransferase family protein [unclassified Streptomyces]|uniref:MocR-like pyridoxine biosynthesis transcription factor PdxR n=1 Tax=unclassified Streptomyces TaxID=2593676 RepID=UPI001BE96317|nr:MULTISPECIES: PLP-dependent aminotransferase family protein [unclassified Streptomyces]MBT2405501.1 PLP-dependent aminotransferase family protein [Streptomyces sp. ISL-21]MBT2454419.1 PLP-dependent aminotransferase family protein [Streptomyces sp. ISL-86]MBT2607820.1 PLP-dependent aminotransferase family protein [Streptomyces sp. ISL-87]
MTLHAAVTLVRESDIPLTSQIQQFIKKEVAEGILHPGTRLPSSRRLADDLGVSRSVVVEAYGQLVAEGYLEAVQGAGTQVVRHLDRGAPAPLVPSLLDDGHGHASRPDPAVRWDLRPGGRNVPEFPRREWLAGYQRALHSADPAVLDYPPLAGDSRLRVELARYLGRMCGVRSTPGQVMVTAGFAQTLGLLSAVLPQLGIDALGIENPGHPGQRRFVRESGLRPVPLPVDAEGIDVAALAASGVRAVLVTPAHQFPTGSTLSAERREVLVRWAREVDGLIIEDDYDRGLWYERGAGRPLALQRLAPEHVVYAGTVSKTLAPGLRLGWLAAPAPLLDRLLRARARQDLGTDVLTQLAFAEFLRGGAYDRHLRRLNSLCRDRHSALREAVRRHLPGAAVVGRAAGLHAYVTLPRHTDEAGLVAGALRRSVLLAGAAACHARPGEGAPALVVGHAHLPRSGADQAIREVAAVLRG